MKNASRQPSDSPMVRALWLAGGWVMFAFGAVGIILPLIPTVGPWIVAAFCFGHASPALRDRIFAHPRYGRCIYLYLEHHVMARPHKIAAVLGIGVSGTLTLFLASPPGLYAAGLAAILSGVALYLVTLSEPSQHLLTCPVHSGERANATRQEPPSS